MCKTDFGLICKIKSHFLIHNTVHNYCTQKIEIPIVSLPSNLLGVKNCCCCCLLLAAAFMSMTTIPQIFQNNDLIIPPLHQYKTGEYNSIHSFCLLLNSPTCLHTKYP